MGGGGQGKGGMKKGGWKRQKNGEQKIKRKVQNNENHSYLDAAITNKFIILLF